jgi:GNAT superfamily N-acetyltransferase
MIVQLSVKDRKRIFNIINTAAQVYKGVIPADCYHEPYMPEEEMRNEINTMTFFGWEEEQKLIGVMGFQPVRDVTLIRHAYVHPQYQGKGIGTKLLAHLKQLTKTSRLLVGTWADASWAIHFYQKHGFTLQRNKDELLLNYWNISERQRETSVVLEIRTDR